MYYRKVITYLFSRSFLNQVPLLIDQATVVSRVDKAIYWINLYRRILL